MGKPIPIEAILASLGLLAAGSAVAQTPVDAQRDPARTEVWKPVPAVVATPKDAAPSDAIVLFDGKDLSAWEAEQGGNAPWSVAGGAVTIARRNAALAQAEAVSQEIEDEAAEGDFLLGDYDPETGTNDGADKLIK